MFGREIAQAECIFKYIKKSLFNSISNSIPLNFWKITIDGEPKTICLFRLENYLWQFSGGGNMIPISMSHEYKNIISIKNLCNAWTEFIRGKKSKKDVAEFSLNLSQNIFRLHDDLRTKTYRHGSYEAFSISDPKPRNIHKANVRDRLLHHAIHRILYPHFDKKFIDDSYSCRLNKGTHKAINRFKIFSSKVSKNNTKTAWVLKCDIKKFFASIDHNILLFILEKHIEDQNTIWLLEKVITSFNCGIPEKGLPLGNLTSQLLANVYMNEFDRFVKHKLRTRYYIRYADDFVIFSRDKDKLLKTLSEIDNFLLKHLKLNLHPDKVFIRTIASGNDFLGWIHFPRHRVLRTSTKRRMFRRVKKNQTKETIASYLGLLKHGSGYKIERKLNEILDSKI